MKASDAIIVGGGPAGSSMARALTRAGLSVRVLDRHDFPRDKLCAGWVTPAVLTSLDHQNRPRLQFAVKPLRSADEVRVLSEHPHQSIISRWVDRIIPDPGDIGRSGMK